MNHPVRLLILLALVSSCAVRTKHEPPPPKETPLTLNLLPREGEPAPSSTRHEAVEEKETTAPGKTALPIENPSAADTVGTVRLVPAEGKKKNAIEIDAAKVVAPHGHGHSLPDSDSVTDVEVRKGVHGEEHGGVDPIKALRWLRNGNARFVKKNLRSDGQSPKDVQRLASGQKPHTVILSCSDSRVPPELVFDQKLGEIFVVRTAGEALDSNVIGSIEYAVEHLGARLIVVMGHTACGAVRAAIDTLKGGDAGSPSLNELVADIHPRIRSEASIGASKDLHVESSANARGVAKDLVTRSKILAQAVRSGKIVITSSLYNMQTGTVDFE